MLPIFVLVEMCLLAGVLSRFVVLNGLVKFVTFSVYAVDHNSAVSGDLHDSKLGLLQVADNHIDVFLGVEFG